MASALFLLGFLAPLHFGFDLFVNMRLQLSMVLLVVTTLALLFRKWIFGALFTILLVIGLIGIVGYWIPMRSESTGQSALRIVSTNVRAENVEREACRSSWVDSGADIVVVLEVSRTWGESLESFEAFPHRIIEPRDNHFGIAVLSKIPLRRIETVGLLRNSVPSIICQPDWDEPFTLIATHPVPPMSQRGAQMRNQQLQRLANRIQRIEGPIVCAGDLNVTPWSPHFKRLVHQSGLHDARMGFGLNPTWPSFFPWLLQIPIDYVLVSDQWQVDSFESEYVRGSDHKMVVVDLSVSDRSR